MGLTSRCQLAYNFMDLAWITRIQILRKLSLLDPDEIQQEHAPQLTKILNTAEQNNLLATFWDEVEQAHLKIWGRTPRPNPFSGG